MKHLWQQLLNRIARKLGMFGTLNTDKTIRKLKVENINLKKEIEQQRGFTTVWIDPTVRQKGYEQSAWNAEPERHTDPTHIHSIRDTSVTRSLHEKQDALIRNAVRMSKQARRVSTTDPIPTNVLPHAPRNFDSMIHAKMPPGQQPPRTFTTRRLQPYDGPPSEDETLHETPTFLQDRQVS